MAAQAAALAVLLDPLAQARPLAQQRFVGDLDGAFADGDEAALGEGGEHAARLLVALDVELGERGAAAHDRLAFSLAGQAQQDASGDRPLLLGEPAVGVLGEPRDGAVDAARSLVGGERERVVRPASARARAGRWRAAAAPPGSSLDVGDERVRELGLDLQAGAGGG